METQELSRRYRKKLATRQALRSAALRLVAERGYDRVTVEDIAEGADVSVRTLFNHFPSKEDVLVGMDPDRLEDLHCALGARPADEAPLQTLRVVLSKMSQGMAAQRADMLAGMRVLQQNPNLRVRQLASFAAFEKMLADTVGERCGLDPDVDLYPTLTAAAAIAALRAATTLWLASDGTAPLGELFEDAFEQLAVGLSQPLPTRASASRRRSVSTG